MRAVRGVRRPDPDRPGRRNRADAVRALSFSPRRPLRRRRQPDRDPADDLRHHAAGSGRADPRRGRAGRAAVGRDRLVDRPACWRSLIGSARPRARSRCCRPCRAGHLARWSSAGCGWPMDQPDPAGGVSCRSRLERSAPRWRRCPDLLVTGDGQHLALVRDDGVPVLLRSRSGDFVRDLMSEASAYDGDPASLGGAAFRPLQPRRLHRRYRPGRSTPGACLPSAAGDRIDWTSLTRACADADIVVADRWLPKGARRAG